MSEPATAPVTAPTKAPFKKPRSRKRECWYSDRTQHNHAVSRDLERVNFTPAAKIDSPNLFSLGAALRANPDLANSFDPDYENMLDAQQSFEHLVNRSVLVFDIANAPAQNTGLISYE
jgi:hypothetical protein